MRKLDPGRICGNNSIQSLYWTAIFYWVFSLSFYSPMRSFLFVTRCNKVCSSKPQDSRRKDWLLVLVTRSTNFSLPSSLSNEKDLARFQYQKWCLHSSYQISLDNISFWIPSPEYARLSPCYSWLYKTFRLSHYDKLSSFHLSENLDYKRPLSLLYISSEKVREAFQVIISISLNNTRARRRDPSLFPQLCPISSDHEANCLTLRPTYPTVLPLPVRSLSRDWSTTAWRRHF